MLYATFGREINGRPIFYIPKSKWAPRWVEVEAYVTLSAPCQASHVFKHPHLHSIYKLVAKSSTILSAIEDRTSEESRGIVL